jgi:hypothetical protein
MVIEDAPVPKETKLAHVGGDVKTFELAGEWP